MKLTHRCTFTAGAAALVLDLTGCSGGTHPATSTSSSSSSSSSSGTGGHGVALGAVAVPGTHAGWWGVGDGGAPPGDAGPPRPFDDTALYLVVGGPLAPTCNIPVPLQAWTPNYPPDQADVSIQVPQGDQQPGTLSLQTRAIPTPTDALEICAGSPCDAG